MADFVTVTTTTDNLDEANRLASSAVDAELAACGQVSSPITSFYTWQGKKETTTEYRIDFKTRASLAEKLTEHLKANHSYDTPEVIVIPIIGGNDDYMLWIAGQTRAD